MLINKGVARKLSEIIGQTNAIKYLQQYIPAKRADPGNTTSTLILESEPGLGQGAITSAFGSSLQCRNPINGFDACLECESCLSMSDHRQEYYVDCNALTEDSYLILIEKIRAFLHQEEFFMFVLDNADKLNVLNPFELTKLIDLSPGNIVYILHATNAKNLPLEPRKCCYKLFRLKHFTPPEMQALTSQMLEEMGVSAEPEAIEFLADHSDPDAISLREHILECAPPPDTTEMLTLEQVGRYLHIPTWRLTESIIMAVLKTENIRDKVNNALRHSTVRNICHYARQMLLDAVSLAFGEVSIGSEEYANICRVVYSALSAHSHAETLAFVLARAFTEERSDLLIFSLYAVRSRLKMP